MKNILIVLLLTIQGISYAQDIKIWREGSIGIEDFKASPIEDLCFSSELSYGIEYQYETVYIEEDPHSMFRTYAYIRRDESWFASYDTISILTYNQCLFNIVEWHSRLLERDLNLKGSSSEGSLYRNYELFDKHNENLRKDLYSFRHQSKYGLVDSILSLWEDSITQLLNLNPRVLPEVVLKDQGFKIDYGTGYTLYQGDIPNYLNNHFYGLNFGMLAHYNRSNFEFRSLIGGAKSKQEWNHELYEMKLDTFNYVSQISFNYGYDILRTSKLSIQPTVGFGIFQMSRTDPNNRNQTLAGPVMVYPLTSINFDYNFDVFKTDHNGQYNLYLRTRFEYARINYIERLQGAMINVLLSIGVNFISSRYSYQKDITTSIQ